MKSRIVRWGLVVGLTLTSFYILHGDTDVPDLALDAVSLLSTPIEDLLPDLSPDVDTSQPFDPASLDLEKYQDLFNERKTWNAMRRLVETGQPLTQPLPSEIVISTAPTGRLAPQVPPPPGFTVQLPYESRLTVSGRKTIGFNYKSTRQTDTAYANQQGLVTSQSNFELQQQLQVRINGQVGRKVTVNVDFDDTKEDKKDISIVYKGDPDELVQRAAFGDINLSLPQTEFVGYNKQLFGASAELKYKALKGYFIGSRTKGETETKEFVGNVILQRQEIFDTAYQRHRFYSVRQLNGGANDVIDQNTLKVYLDNRDGSRPITDTPLQNPTIDPSLLPGAVAYNTGRFKLLSPGADYTVDPTIGVITFRNTLTAESFVAIDYGPVGGALISTTRGTTGQLKMLKYDESQVLAIPKTEDLTHYITGAQKIVRDNGQGNFVFKILDANRNDVGNSLGINYLPNNAGNIFFDFEQGTFYLQKNRFDTNSSANADIYVPTPTHRYTFFVEYRARVKTYTLRPNIVLNSERILLNGRVLTRDVDYFIDYESGFITFFNEDQITEATRIVATYDFSPFGVAGAQQDTLVGSRLEMSLYPVHPLLSQSLIGTSVLYDFAPKQTAAPDIRQTAGSFVVSEADFHLKDLIFNPFPLLKSSFTGEVARSQRNPNTFGSALIDNLEGIKDETTITLNQLNYEIAANPGQQFGSRTNVAYASALATTLTNDTVRTKDVNPNAAVLDSDKQQVLNLNYDLRKSSEASIVTLLSSAGLDFSKKLYIEMYVQGDGTAAGSTPSQTELNITLGQTSEDADGTGGDSQGRPKTEDANLNNLLDLGEDVGWSYINPDGSTTLFRPGNLRLDSEDLDRNGVLDRGNSFVGGDIGYNSTVSSFTAAGASGLNRVDFSGWKYIQVPLNISSGTSVNWRAIKELRISLRSSVPGGTTGVVRIGKINVVGSRWLVDSPIPQGSTFTVRAINNEDFPDYSSPSGPDFDALNQINTALSGPQPTKRKEQSLALAYQLQSGSSATATSSGLSPMDFTAYGSIRFFLYGDASGASFILRSGSDSDYLQFKIPVTWKGWREIFIRQVDTNGDNRPDVWANDPMNPAPGQATVVGSPNLTSVSQLRVGVINETAGTTSGEVWFDELHANDVITRVGYAKRARSDFEVLGWGTAGVGLRDIDRNFETFSSAITNQDRHEEEGYLTLTRLRYFPMKFTGYNRRTITPAINNFSNNTLVSVLQEGRVDERFYSAAGNLQVPLLPKIGLSYDTNKVQSQELFRTDKTDNYGITMDYALPGRHAFLPKNVQLGYKRTNFKLDFGNGALNNSVDPFTVSNTRDVTNDMSAKLAFEPINGFTFNPNYSLVTTHEFKDAITDSTTLRTAALEYDKSRAQTTGFDGVLGFKRWFSPRVRYSINTRETYGIPLVTDLSAADFKSVDRTSTGEASWDLAFRDLTNKVRMFQSLNISSSYLLEDGDSWDKIAGGYNSLSILSVRKSLTSGNADATRRQLTLRDTLRSTQRWSPFDWASGWTGIRAPLRTLSLTSTYTDTKQRQETTGTPSKILTRIAPDMIVSLTQTESFFHAERFMSNSQMNLKTQYKTVDTLGTSLEKSKLNGGDWRLTLVRKFDIFVTYTRTSDKTFDVVNNVVSNDATGETLGAQMGVNIGKWRFTPKYDQTKQQAVDSSGRLTTDLTTRVPALQAYADLYLPAGLKLPFGDLVVFSNRIRNTSTVSLTQKRSSLNALQDNTDAYSLTTSADYEMTSNVRLTVGGGYSYIVNKVSAAANSYSYELNSLLTIQF